VRVVCDRVRIRTWRRVFCPTQQKRAYFHPPLTTSVFSDSKSLQSFNGRRLGRWRRKQTRARRHKKLVRRVQLESARENQFKSPRVECHAFI